MTASTLSEKVHETLEADATLMATLTGGLYLVDAPTTYAGTTGKHLHPINPDDTPTAYGAVAGTSGTGAIKQLKPCGIVYTSTEVPKGRRGVQRFVVVSLFDKDGYVNIIAARDRVRVLLHDTVLRVASRGHEVALFAIRDSAEDPELITGVGKRPAAMATLTFTALSNW